jgi:acetyltransferase-like isoleucine patch superfamily enzyme
MGRAGGRIADSLADGARVGSGARLERPEPPLSLRTLARRAKRRVMSLFPPAFGSVAWCEQRGLLVIGRHSYGPAEFMCVYAGDSAKVTIGKWCSLASDVEIMPGGNHRVDTVTTYPIQRLYGLPGVDEAGQPWSKGDVVIGNDVWIGRGAKILGGVSIGDGAVVAAFSVVTKSVAPYTIVAGVPARVIRPRFEQEIVESLLRIRWWDWSDTLVLERINELTSNDLLAFTRKYDASASASQNADAVSAHPPG